MKSMNQRGKIGKKSGKNLLNRLIHGNRQKVSALLCAAMVFNGVATAVPTMAAGSEEVEAVQEVRLEREKIREALGSAEQVYETPQFEGENEAVFENLLDAEDGTLYQVSGAVEAEGSLSVQTYAKLSQLQGGDEYVPDESDQLIFLLVNESEVPQTAAIYVNGELVKEVAVPDKSGVPVIEERMEILEEISAAEEEEETSAAAEEETSAAAEEETSAAEEEETSAVAEEETSAAAEEETSAAEEENSAAEEEETSAAEEEEDLAAAAEEETSAAAEEETSAAAEEEKPAEETEEEPSEEPQASISIHEAPLLTVRATEAEYENAALMDDKAVVYFVMSAEELGLMDDPDLPPLPVAPEDWDISKTKEATNLDENFESQITLSLPSAEEQLETDVVFVLDKSTSAEVENQILEMLANLKNEGAEKQAKINVGVVIFNREANRVCELTDLSAGYGQIENAILTKISSGTNLHAGLLAGKAMLDEDTDVDANRKYLIVVSDGITYIYGETPTSVALQNADKTNIFAGPDNWQTKYGTNEAPNTWEQWLAEIGGQIQADGATYEVPYGTENQYIPYDERASHAMSIDHALYESYLVYTEAKASGYRCYADLATTNADHPWAQSFMEFLAGGEAVDFSAIQNDILYLLDSGSSVVDVIGQGTSNLGDPYDFTFINDLNRMELTVNGIALDKAMIGSEENASYSYGFGAREDGSYRFVVTYYPNGTEKTAGEHFVWEINEAISNFAPVQFKYAVKLIQAPTTEGTHGQYDGNGEHGYNSLYTNEEATLYPVDTNGTTYPPETFPKPTVSYTVDNGGGETPDPTPEEKQYTITINYYRKSDNTVLRDSQTITLDANAAYDINEQVNLTISGYNWDSYTVPENQTEALVGTLTGNLVFNVYYVSSGGGHHDGGSSGGGGPTGGGAYTPSGGPGMTITEEEVPLAPLPETETGTVIADGEVPLASVPKMGESPMRAWTMMVLSGALMALVSVLAHRREE